METQSIGSHDVSTHEVFWHLGKYQDPNELIPHMLTYLVLTNVQRMHNITRSSK